jgi:hypothetical protein
VGFRDLVVDQLLAARDAAEANDLLGESELGEWWRDRARDLELVLIDLTPRAPAATWTGRTPR